MSDTDDWEDLGRELLQSRLDHHADEIHVAFRDLATRVGRGEPVEQSDLKTIRDAIAQGEIFLDRVEELTRADDTD